MLAEGGRRFCYYIHYQISVSSSKRWSMESNFGCFFMAPYILHLLSSKLVTKAKGYSRKGVFCLPTLIWWSAVCPVGRGPLKPRQIYFPVEKRISQMAPGMILNIAKLIKQGCLNLFANFNQIWLSIHHVYMGTWIHTCTHWGVARGWDLCSRKGKLASWKFCKEKQQKRRNIWRGKKNWGGGLTKM